MAENTAAKATGVGGAAAAVFAAIFGFSIKDDPSGPNLTPYQQRCSIALSYLITQVPLIEPKGKYAVTLGEAFRPQSVAMAYAKQGLGISNSLHTKRLAVDLNLFVDGQFATDGAAHKPIAELWMEVGKHFGVTPSAGYYFNDGNHYGCSWKGVK